MLDSITGFLKKIVGNKYDRDIKEVDPVVEQINLSFLSLQGLSNDELRNKTLEFKNKINAFISDEQHQIDDIRKKVGENSSMDILEKENLYNEIDQLEEKITTKIAEILDELLPEAFAVVKETARRFKENEFVEVTATTMDKDIAALPPSELSENQENILRARKIAESLFQDLDVTKRELIQEMGFRVDAMGNTILVVEANTQIPTFFFREIFKDDLFFNSRTFNHHIIS